MKPGGFIERSWDNENGNGNERKGNGTMLRGGGNGGGGLRLTYGEKEIWNSKWERGVQVRALGRRLIDVSFSLLFLHILFFFVLSRI